MEGENKDDGIGDPFKKFLEESLTTEERDDG
jgi:hypothetical protein